MIKSKNHNFSLLLIKPALYILISLLIITFFVYLNLLFAGFLDYDDVGNVVKNENISSLSIKNIIALFTTSVYYSYNPITFLSYALENLLFGLKPEWFHATNIVLHLMNVLLVFQFIFLLTQERKSALIAATLFALHPIHSDVVGWISARNYLLCTLFYLSSLVFYIRYLTASPRRNANLILSLVFFVMACLSKSQAVTLALVILLLNWKYKVKYDTKQWIILFIYLCISAATGLATLYFRADMGKTEIIPNYTFVEKIMVICFSILKYLGKLIYPFNLTAIESFPFKSPAGWLPIVVYLSPVMIAIAIFFGKWSKKITPIILIGILFFTLNILITQVTFLEDGFSANRYFYLSSIGIYLPISFVVNKLYEKAGRYRKWMIVGCCLILVLLSVKTYRRSNEWMNTLTLSNSIIKKSRDVIMAYNIRGIWYYNQKEYDLSINNYNEAIAVFPNYSPAYFNRALALAAKQENAAALNDYTRAIELNPNFESAYQSRGVLLLDVFRDYPKAMADFKKALLLKPGNAQAYYNLGLTYFRMQDVENACKNWYQVRALGYKQADGMIDKYCR
jgi:tetratricopeptide (TPR) repeat protein